MCGLADALSSYSDGGTEAMSNIIGTSIKNYAGQFIPAPVGALARTIDDTVRSSYASKDSAIGKGNEQWRNTAPHGAGRIMSRTQAKKQIGMDDYRQTMSDVFSTSICEATLDESPMVYKPTEEILELVKPTVDIISMIKPKLNIKDKGE